MVKAAAKLVQIEQKTKYYLSFFSMQPNFDLCKRSEVRIKSQHFRWDFFSRHHHSFSAAKAA